MANVMTVDGVQAVQQTERNKSIRYRVVLSGAYVQAVRSSNVGELLDLTKAVGVAGKEGQFWGPKGASAGYVLQGPGGFGARILPGADALHWLLQVFGVTPGTELAAGAYAAGITGDQDFLILFEGLGGGQS